MTIVSSDLLTHPFQGMDVATLLAHQASQRGEHAFLVWEPFEGDPQTWTYAEFQHDVRRIAAGLQKRGVGLGDHILIHLDNCPESLLAWYACAFVGAVAVTTNAQSTADELSYFAQHSNAKAAITQPVFAELVASSMPSTDWIAVTTTDCGAPPAHAPAGADTFEALRDDADAFRSRLADPQLPVGIQYTSGTTSRPKGVVWTHANALWGAKLSAHHEYLGPDDVHLTFLPLFHTNAQSYSVLASLWVGATVVLQPRFSASRFWDLSLKHGCTWSSMVPFCVRALEAHDVPEHSYRYWGNGIANPPWDPHFQVQTIGWWGMTETITHGIVSDPHQPAPPMSIGRPSPGYQVAIVDADGRPVRPGETGDLLLRGVPGLSLFKEYLKNPEATAASFDDQGFFITGDRVTLLEDGNIAFADRDKDMLKVGGENVAASEVERVIMTVDGVEECAVVGKPDAMLDEVPVAFIRLSSSEGSEAEIMLAVEDICAAKLAKFKRPHEFRTVDEFPRATLNKIAKGKLRDLLDQH